MKTFAVALRGRIVWACVCLFWCQAQAVGFPGGFLAKDLSEAVSKDGAQTVVDTLLLSSGRRDWLYVLEHVEAGETAWLNVTPELMPGVNGEAGAELRKSLALALPRNPAAVLKLINADINVDYLCTAPVARDNLNERRRYLRNVLHALAYVKDPDIQDHRSFCLQEIQQVQQSIEVPLY